MEDGYLQKHTLSADRPSEDHPGNAGLSGLNAVRHSLHPHPNPQVTAALRTFTIKKPVSASRRASDDKLGPKPKQVICGGLTS